MNKLKMHTANKADENFKKLAELFPNAITETIDENGEVIRAIDKDVLMQEINTKVVDGKEERYQFTWPDKKKSMLLANQPINKTLRPCVEQSVGKDGTKGGFDSENLYIEGDNLEVLKLLQETYLGKIKMIYIDPPYNTGNDFVYNDDFKINAEEWDEVNRHYDEDGNRLVKNLDSNGRFHTDWLNMMYPRLKLAKDLLTDDGVIFISIDDNEQDNLKKICDEIFGAVNFIAMFIRKTSSGEKTAKPKINKHHDYLLCYARNIKTIQNLETIRGYEKNFEEYSNPDNDPNGEWKKDSLLIKIDNGRYGYARYGITNPYLNITHYPPVYYDEKNRKQWHYVEETFKNMVKENRVVFYKNKDDYKGEYSFYIKKYKKEIKDLYNNLSTLNYISNDYTNSSGTYDLSKVFVKGEFDNIYPKPVKLITDILYHLNKNDKEMYVLDFFSGSATTAEGVIRYNAFDSSSDKIKYILVQVPDEPIGESNYKNICEIGKERIRRAGKKILEEAMEETVEFAEYGETYEIDSLIHKYNKLDIGFRVLKCDSTNMKDVYYNPAEYTQQGLAGLTDNIKEDRTPKDLLFQVMLDLGVLLSSKIEEQVIDNKKVFNVADGFLMACFDEDITEEVITKIAKEKPYYFVMRDKSMEKDSIATNFEQIFATYSPDTVRKVL